MSVTIQDPRTTPRHLIEQMRKFVQLADAPPSASGSSLSEVGFVLLTLKDQILAETPRSLNFCQEFISRPLNGIELLSKVIIVLQNIVNSSQGASSKISNLLSKNSSNTNRKRKAAVAEADCIECIKILLEKSDVAWRLFLESATGLDAVLYSVHSPQLDSKCYALEILLLLLDQAQGFVILFRALTSLAAKNRDFLRLLLFVAQLKHGLHTSKLHIQILVVRLFNKLLASAPTPTHRSLIKVEATLAQFSVEYVEKLIAIPQVQFGGVSVLMEELNIWKSFSSQSMVFHGNTIEHSHIYGHSETESDVVQSDRTRKIKTPITKYPMGNTSVVKNVERQRLKKQGVGSGGRASGPSYYPDNTGRHTTAAYLDRRSDLSSQGWSLNSDTAYSPPLTSHGIYATERTAKSGGMRRAKSEGTMVIEDRADDMDGTQRRLKRFDEEQPLYHSIQHAKTISKSVHDLSMRDDHSRSVGRPASARPSSAAQNRTMMRTISPRPNSPLIRDIRRHSSPSRGRFGSPTSPRARFAEPKIVEAQQPHAGFSYLFPTQPVLASVVPKRAITPEPYTKHHPVTQSPSTPLYAGISSISRVLSPSPLPQPDYETRPTYSENGHVVYIPINMDNGRRLNKSTRYERRDSDYSADSRSNSRSKQRSPSINGTMREDVRDALSQFDYLNDYDNSSPREKEKDASYHF